jgi:hypothetical protein
LILLQPTSHLKGVERRSRKKDKKEPVGVWKLKAPSNLSRAWLQVGVVLSRNPEKEMKENEGETRDGKGQKINRAMLKNL